MASVFWDSEGVIHIDFLLHGVIINAQYYSNVLRNDAHPHMAGNTDSTRLRNHGHHPPYSPDLAPSDFHLLGAMKGHLGQKFITDNKVRHGVLNWLCSQDKTIYIAGFSNLPGRWKKTC
jgi:hypothetical protein